MGFCALGLGFKKKKQQKMGMGFQFEQHSLGLWDLSCLKKKKRFPGKWDQDPPFTTLIFESVYLFLVPTAPSLEINTVEFPNQDVLPTGHNTTIICTSNFSKDDWGRHYYSQPYWIQLFFNDADYLGDCGGSDDDIDREDSKVCTYVVQNATERDSGNYSCVSYNQIACTYGTIVRYFESKY